ncbi:hypothetical protein CYMTET_37587 [Cymbomonas tetramitiformis]|uniref:Reverse transcriptase RNase H-like domain-containing protein n=1 Tax=Cymbomonas tetramitiformis TaxID=36881 RepID=A0AAE0CFF1_9CHLO|nr:hypothetical protein CYMTET_37587 [Cymbomonas tetramitiformis]
MHFISEAGVPITDDLHGSAVQTPHLVEIHARELPDSVQSREYKVGIRLRPDPNGNPLHRRGYKLSQEELRQLRRQLDELLAKGYIRPSASPWDYPVLMVPKPSNPKELRLVIDYRQINEITIKDKYPLPDVQSLLDDLQGATVFSTMDALWGFWVFVDDIMIFSAEVPGKSAHEQDKVASVRDWPDLETVTHVRQFLGMCGFYRRYIQNFADLAYPLTRLTKSGVEWTWGENEKAAFKQLKTALISSPALALPDQKGAADGSRPFFVQTDASGVALGGVLMQDQGRGLQPLAFESRQFSSAEQNYHAGERELCAIHHCTTVTWRHYLIFTSFKLMGDHKPLQRLFAPARELSRRQARWYEDLVEVGVHQMEHVPGRCLVVPDAQSRRPDYQEMSAREGLKEKGIVDRATDGPRDSEPKGKGSEEDEDPTSVLGIVDRATDGPRDSEPKGKRSEEDEDPTSVLGATFEYSDSEDESFPPTSPSPVIGELTHLNGLTWVETPALWLDAADTLAVGEKSLRDAESLAGMTRANRAREQAAAEVQSHPEAAKEAPETAESPHPETQSHPKAAREAPEPVTVDTYWTDCLKEKWRGKHVWCSPPYTKDSDLIERILRHFLAEWRADPENTSAMFLLPDYDAPWRRLIHPKYGLHPVKVFDMKDERGRPNHLFESPDGVKKGTTHETARQFVRQLQLAREKLLLAQQQQIAQYDARHKARSYALGDEVWVDATYLTQPGDRGLHKKLLKKRLGPLRVLEVFHSDRQMALPASDRGAPSAYRLQTPKQ